MASTINISSPEDRRRTNLEEHLLSALSEDPRTFEVSDDDGNTDIVALMKPHTASVA